MAWLMWLWLVIVAIPFFIGLSMFCYASWQIHKFDKELPQEFDEIDEVFQEFYEECRRNNINFKGDKYT